MSEGLRPRIIFALPCLSVTTCRRFAPTGDAPAPAPAPAKPTQASIVPPYDVGKFPNKWRKMWSDQPARTLMARRDRYSSSG